jgi:hypothetical protein
MMMPRPRKPVVLDETLRVGLRVTFTSQDDYALDCSGQTGVIEWVEEPAPIHDPQTFGLRMDLGPQIVAYATELRSEP